jgi:hypothetical protein
MDAEVKQVFVKSSTKATPEAAPKKITKSRRVLPKSKPVPAARKTTAKATAHKTYPMGALKGTRQTRRAKLEPTSNPSMSPPMKRKSTIRVLTPVGQQKKEQKVEEEGGMMPAVRMRAELDKAGHGVSKKAPDDLVRQIWKAANLGGFLK